MVQSSLYLSEFHLKNNSQWAHLDQIILTLNNLKHEACTNHVLQFPHHKNVQASQKPLNSLVPLETICRQFHHIVQSSEDSASPVRVTLRSPSVQKLPPGQTKQFIATMIWPIGLLKVDLYEVGLLIVSFTFRYFNKWIVRLFINCYEFLVSGFLVKPSEVQHIQCPCSLLHSTCICSS